MKLRRRVLFPRIVAAAPVERIPDSPRRFRGFEHISKVFGASPAIVFEPMGPQESIRRPLRSRAQNKGWQKFQAIINGGVDHRAGYDDGEYEPQTRGIHSDAVEFTSQSPDL